MTARRPNLANAAIEFSFVVLAGALGVFGAPLWSLAALVVLMLAYWAYSRRNALRVMTNLHLGALFPTALAVTALLALVLGGAYWLGSLTHGASR